MQGERRVGIGSGTFTPRPSMQPNYGSLESGLRRHEFQAPAFPVPAGFPALAPGEYFGHILAGFRRTFSGATSDVPPTATASNNFQSTRVMNGSRIENFRAKITIKNRSNIGGWLGVYRVALSFYDALIWDTLISTSCPVTFDSTGVGPPDTRGRVDTKAVSTTLITKNNWRNYKTVQHYMEYLGDIQLTPEDSDKGLVEIEITDIPPKCRRSNTGMFYAYFFHNSSDMNGAETLQITSSVDVSFDEIPAEDRLPYVN